MQIQLAFELSPWDKRSIFWRFDDGQHQRRPLYSFFVVWNVESGARGSIQLVLGVSLVPVDSAHVNSPMTIVSLSPHRSLPLSCLLRTLIDYIEKNESRQSRNRLTTSDRLAFQASFIKFLLIDHEFDNFSDWLARDREKAAPANTDYYNENNNNNKQIIAAFNRRHTQTNNPDRRDLLLNYYIATWK